MCWLNKFSLYRVCRMSCTPYVIICNSVMGNIYIYIETHIYVIGLHFRKDGRVNAKHPLWGRQYLVNWGY